MVDSIGVSKKRGLRRKSKEHWILRLSDRDLGYIHLI